MSSAMRLPRQSEHYDRPLPLNWQRRDDFAL
jgi:hypothetical protein